MTFDEKVRVVGLCFLCFAAGMVSGGMIFVAWGGY